MTTPAQAHSPLPWHLKRIGENLYIEHEHGFIADMQRDESATYLDQAGELAELEANAAYILRACNNAQRLADALTQLLRAVNAGLETDFVPYPPTKQVEESNEQQYEQAQKSVCEAREALADWNAQ